MAPLIRNIKNAMYTSTEAEVRNATSNEPTNTPVHELSSIAAKTFSPTMFPKIMNILEIRLNDKGKSWRHVLKSLQVLEYCLIHGSEATAQWCKSNLHYIRTLRQFVYMEDGVDVGANVRVAATTLTSLITDSDLLQTERQKQGNWKSRLPAVHEGSSSESHATRSRAGSRHTRRDDDEDAQLKLAIQASINAAREEEEKRRTDTSNDDELAKAIKLSEEEDASRKRQGHSSSGQPDHLIDFTTPAQTPTTSMMPQMTGWNQGYQQQGAVDWFGNPIDPSQQQQAMNTGYLNPAPQVMYNTGYMFATPTGVMPVNPQMTGYMPQQPGFDPNSPYGQQPGLAQAATSSTNNPWAPPTTEQRPQPTGSNNPFAPRSQNEVKMPSMPNQNSLLMPSMKPPSMTPTMSSHNTLLPPLPVTKAHTSNNNLSAPDSHIARLNQLLSTGEGIDTFGNSGELRVPSHHTAGTYINSAGWAGGSGAQQQHLQNSMTGAANPFGNQFTGMPRGTLAQTGTGNPFGAGPGQPNGRSTQDPPNLIDI